MKVVEQPRRIQAISHADSTPANWLAPTAVLIVSASLWAVLFVTVPPADQDFPLADDWAYAQGTFTFAAGGGIHYPQWSSMPQLGQWFWACPFVWLVRYRFVALRIATLVLGELGLIAFYDLLRQQGFRRAVSALLMAALALNPLFFLLQGTYMTDVPALSLALIALAFYGRAFQSEHAGWLIPAVGVAVLAVITRQNTVSVALAAGLLLTRLPGLRGRALWWIAVAVPFVAGIATHLWFQARPDVVPATPDVPQPDELVFLPYFMAYLCGLSALPILVLCPGVGSWRRWIVVLLIVLANAGYWWVFGPQYLMYGRYVPYTDAMLTPYGAYSGGLMPGERPVLLSVAFRRGLTLVACLAATAFITRLWERRRGPMTLLGLFTLWQIPFLLIAPEIWDRYLLVLFPGALALSVTSMTVTRKRWVAALALVALFGVISLGLMHDWLSWNSARWRLGRTAVAQGIDSSEIEGGFEWDGWYAPPDRPAIKSLAQFFQHSRKPFQKKGLTLPTTQNWFPNVTGAYAIAFTPLPGTRIRATQDYGQWLLPGKHTMYLVQEIAEPKR